ncbi:HalOD1 output domain-containing protein [Natrialba sp. PRR66]|uniref:HalOD1 output domain-containing protein n=1 Tax=Natrialba sp. PRR66 TaxID=3098146 RepID=UPI002B1E66AD|nr:HalOD1 output domain-containing protein [Natrialba sp. PRR66]
MDSELGQQKNARTASSTTVHREFEISQPASLAAVETVSTAADCDPTELVPLYEVIDPDALDALFGSQSDVADPETRVSFGYEGFTVTIARHGQELTVKATQQAE